MKIEVLRGSSLSRSEQLLVMQTRLWLSITKLRCTSAMVALEKKKKRKTFKFSVLASFMSTCSRLELSEGREPQLRKSLQKIQL